MKKSIYLSLMAFGAMSVMSGCSSDEGGCNLPPVDPDGGSETVVTIL